ncbi:SAM-dependent methyltransferase [Acidaminobacter sp. JC074]|uniref:tRNA (adenine(22)-N(1))-methyltransferase n=1 Tax=Acidaminobacter sp. JC074 TaxID=2530199 RepID=UPI001F10124A|nr:class I SAM-dependent methyltransferase [Acidaminobacter sp. JC074]MCH4887700.1 SAM-dependent methyltransferase [Acidaminobacter sp. JC074]
MKLTNRLQAIAELIDKDVVVGDIGSDHGYLMAYLIEKNIIKKGIASDINEGPVRNCEETVKSHGFTDQIDVRLGGGLLPYKKNEIHTAVIAGMGGQLIRDIILESKVAKTVDTFILQPMTGQDVLRRWLVENNYNIIKEVIANEQDRYYEILVVKHGKQDKTMSDWMIDIDMDDDLIYEIGFKMMMSDDYKGFIDKKIKKYEVIKSNIEKHSKVSDKLDQVKHNLDKLYEVKKCIQI